MKKLIFSLSICSLIVFAGCVSKPDNSIENSIRDEIKNEESAPPVNFESGSDTPNILDTEAIRQKAREEFEKITTERIKHYEIEESKEKAQDAEYLKSKEVDDMLKDKDFMGKIDKNK